MAHATSAVDYADQMSGWEIGHNRFVNCMAGSFIGGGRDNYIHDNYYENCDLAQHFDNRGMGWEQKLCNCTNGSTCDPAVATAIVADPKSGMPAFRFIHPTLPGPGNLGGWMEGKA